MSGAKDAANADSCQRPSQRIDKWLWFARVAKSRTLAAVLVEGGKVRINKVRTTKPSAIVKPGDVVTISLGPQVRLFKVLAPGVKRGPAPEAAKLYEDLTPPPVATKAHGDKDDASAGADAMSQAHATRHYGSGRPTKRDRRRIISFTGRDEDL